MKHIQKIKNIKSVNNRGGVLYYCDDFAILYDSLGNKIASRVECQSFWREKEWLHYHRLNGEMMLVNLEDKDVKQFDFSPAIFTVDKKGIAFCTYEGKRIDRVSYWKLGKVNLHTGQLLAPNKFIDSEKVIHLNNEQFFTNSRKGISSYDMDTFNLCWQLNLKDLGNFESYDKEEKPLKLKQLLGVWQGDLIVVGGENALLLINGQTGELNHIWNKIPEKNRAAYNYSDLIASSAFVLDENKGEVVALFFKSYYVINLRTMSIQEYDIQDEMKKHKIMSFKPLGTYGQHYPVTKNYLFGTAMLYEVAEGPEWSYDCVYAFNRVTYKIDWLYDFKDYNLATKMPILSGSKLYQLDSNNTLHIFEDVEGTLLSDDTDKLGL